MPADIFLGDISHRVKHWGEIYMEARRKDRFGQRVDGREFPYHIDHGISDSFLLSECFPAAVRRDVADCMRPVNQVQIVIHNFQVCALTLSVFLFGSMLCILKSHHFLNR